MNRLNTFLPLPLTKVKYLSPLLLLFISYVLLAPRSGHDGDFWCWSQWTKAIFEHGLGNTYKYGTNYLPLYQYILFLFGKFQGSVLFIDHNLHYLKMITLFFDFVAGFFLISMINDVCKDFQKSLYLSLFYFFNISYLYNTLIWGQVDGIMACFLFMAFYFAIKQKILLTFIFMVLSLNFKLQSIMLIPLLGLMILPVMVERFSFKKLFVWIAIPLSLQFLIILPFLLTGDLGRLWAVVTGSVDNNPVVSMNAFNFWHWLVKGNLMVVRDSTCFLGISYKHWGMFLFFSTSLVALAPLIVYVYKKLSRKIDSQFPIERLLLIAGIIPLLFFFFNTQMHERYLHPALIFLTAYSIISGKYFLCILTSVAYFLNLERVLQYLQLKNYGTLIFHPKFIAALIFISIIWLFIKIYQYHGNSAEIISQSKV